MKKIILVENDEKEPIGVEFNGVYYERGENQGIAEFIKSVPNLYENFTNKNVKVEPARKRLAGKKEGLKALKEKVKSKKKQIIAAALAVTLVASVGCAVLDKNAKDEGPKTTSEQGIDEEYTQNAELNKLLNQIAKLEDGKEIVNRLLKYYNYQKDFNSRAQEHKDKNGNSIFIKAEEIAAIDAIANGTDMSVVLTIPSKLVPCNYFEGCIALTNYMFISGKTSGLEILIEDKNVKADYKKASNAVADVLADKKGADENCRKVFAKLYKTPKAYPEVASLVSFDGDLITAGLEGAIGGKTVEKDQAETKTNNGVLIYNLNYIEGKEKLQNNNEAMKFTVQTYEVMNEENIKVDEKQREKFDPSTTEKGLRLSKKNGTYNASISEILKSVTSNAKISVSKQRAKEFGLYKVKKAEEEARKNKYVDTNGDGKKDTQIDIANQDQEKKHQLLDGKTKGYEKGHQAGRQDGFNGKSKNTSVPSGDSVLNDSSKSEAYKKYYREGYKEGYLAGYANGVKQKQELEKVEIEKEEVKVERPNSEKNDESEFKPSNKPSEEKPSYKDDDEYILDEEVTTEKPKKVVSVESSGNVHTSETQEKPKVRSYGAQL